MDPLVFGAALLSAALHAGWNAAVKAHAHPGEVMAGQMIAAAVLSLPGLLWLGLPAAAAWPWMLLSSALNTVAVLALLRAYRRGDFGTVYPVARAVSVLGVAAVAPLLMGESLGSLTALGVALIAGALGLLAWDARRPGGGSLPPAAFGWTLVAGGFIACNAMSDAQGVRLAGSSMAYCFAVSICNAVVISGLNRRLGSPWALVRRHARVTLPAAVVSNLSYLLILWVYQRAPVAQGAALRDTSAVFALLIAVFWLKEPLSWRRWMLIAWAVAGVALLRLG